MSVSSVKAEGPSQDLGEIPGVWRGGRPVHEDAAGAPTGFEALDKELPGKGWPTTALTELHCDTPGVGEMRLLAPVLGQITRAEQTVMLFTAPKLARLPVEPYAPALLSQNIDLARVLIVRPDSEAQLLWALEQVLRAGAGSGVGACIAWLEKATFPALRRLQLAAETGGTPAFIFRPEALTSQSSPAPLRLQLWAQESGLAVRILKRRGAWLDNPILVSMPPPGALSLPAMPRETVHPLDRPVLAPSAARPARATAAAA